ncbi:uncharacterized protein LOC122808107 [Protopterus annectens]|uniref:uncharacterized protein LOC122808107 n=1 Tax=Protopterus annectens TaxID=7888 RepID=UPI001CF9B2A9|nr:uncharacterized protein LOC122808107 [Protopterus annectens]
MGIFKMAPAKASVMYLLGFLINPVFLTLNCPYQGNTKPAQSEYNLTVSNFKCFTVVCFNVTVDATIKQPDAVVLQMNVSTGSVGQWLNSNGGCPNEWTKPASQGSNLLPFSATWIVNVTYNGSATLIAFFEMKSIVYRLEKALYFATRENDSVLQVNNVSKNKPLLENVGPNQNADTTSTAHLATKAPGPPHSASAEDKPAIFTSASSLASGLNSLHFNCVFYLVIQIMLLLFNML